MLSTTPPVPAVKATHAASTLIFLKNVANRDRGSQDIGQALTAASEAHDHLDNAKNLRESSVDSCAKVTPIQSQNPLQQLRGLNRSSSEFPSRLTDILMENWIKNHDQNLSRNDLEEFVEYLDSVRVRIPFTHPLLNSLVGPQRPQPHQPRLLPLFVRTQQDLWYPRGLTNITHTLAHPFGCRQLSGRRWRSGRYTQGDPRRFRHLRQKGPDLRQR